MSQDSLLDHKKLACVWQAVYDERLEMMHQASACIRAAAVATVAAAAATAADDDEHMTFWAPACVATMQKVI